MKNKKRPIRCNHHFEKDDTTSSGEFICSYFIWMTPNQQKQRAEELNKMTKKNKSRSDLYQIDFLYYIINKYSDCIIQEY